MVPSRIGSGEIGGKATGLVRAGRMLEAEYPSGAWQGITLAVPAFVVLATDVFDAFVAQKALRGLASGDLADLPDLPDARIAMAFQGGDLPPEILGDLQAIVEGSPGPLAVRSSSLLEDSLHHPFAGIYETKMIPNNAPDPRTRFRRLTEAVKFVLASTWFRAARAYAEAAGKDFTEEKMAVVIQEIVGVDHGERFYPHLSGVARSIHVYPHGPARRDEGVVSLALGLGKTIVDGGASWTYSPAHPASPPPYVSPNELLQNTQLRFWAVNLGAVTLYDPVAETEFLTHAGLDAAEMDGTLRHVASTYDPASDRIVPGVERDGARVLDFAPLLAYETWPVNALVRSLLHQAESVMEGPVEIEFAATLPQPKNPAPPHFGFLQVRPMLLGTEPVTIEADEMDDPHAFVLSDRVLGNGVFEGIRDVVFVKPDAFGRKDTQTVANEVNRLTRPLNAEKRPYVLIGFGRWGSQDPWLGIPVSWDQIAGAKVILEGSLDTLDVEPSQGAHFFQNMTAFGVVYVSLDRTQTARLDWPWLWEQPPYADTPHVRHVRLARPFLVKADGRTGRGGIWRT